jgi:hypothetical protein
LGVKSVTFAFRAFYGRGHWDSPLIVDNFFSAIKRLKFRKMNVKGSLDEATKGEEISFEELKKRLVEK